MARYLFCSSGFLPKFGPTFVNLYGVLPDYGNQAGLNEGLGEGICYKGRILLSLNVDVLEQPLYSTPGATVEPCPIEVRTTLKP